MHRSVNNQQCIEITMHRFTPRHCRTVYDIVAQHMTLQDLNMTLQDLNMTLQDLNMTLQETKFLPLLTDNLTTINALPLLIRSPPLSTLCLSCRYKNESHTDFVTGIVWRPEGLISCSWDSSLKEHLVEPASSHSNGH